MLQPSARKRTRTLTANGLLAGLALAPLIVVGAGASAASATPTDPLRVCGFKGTESRTLTLQKTGSDTGAGLAGATYEVTGLLYELGVGQPRFSENPFFSEYTETRAALDTFTPARDAAAEARGAAVLALRDAEYTLAAAEAAIGGSADLLVAEQRVEDARTALAEAQTALDSIPVDDPGYAAAQAAVESAQAELATYTSEHDAVLAPLQANVDAAAAAVADAQAEYEVAAAAEEQVRADSQAALDEWRDVMEQAWVIGTQGSVTVTTGEDGYALPVKLVRGYKNTDGGCDDIPASVVELAAPAGYSLDTTVFTEDAATATAVGEEELGNVMVVTNDPIVEEEPPTTPEPESPVTPPAAPPTNPAAPPLANTGVDEVNSLPFALVAAGLGLAGAATAAWQFVARRRSA